MIETKLENITPRLTADDIVRRSQDGQDGFIDQALATFRLREARDERRRMWRGVSFALVYTLVLVGIATGIVLYIMNIF
jgi:hypothetical protein